MKSIKKLFRKDHPFNQKIKLQLQHHVDEADHISCDINIFRFKPSTISIKLDNVDLQISVPTPESAKLIMTGQLDIQIGTLKHIKKIFDPEAYENQQYAKHNVGQILAESPNDHT